MVSAIIALSVLIVVAGQTRDRAHDCNNNYYVNSSGHVVHSPSCDQENGPAAECREPEHELLGAPSGHLLHHEKCAH